MFCAAKYAANWLIIYICIHLCSISAVYASESSSAGNQFQFANTSRLVIVSRHQEDTSWLDSTAGDTPHVVYNSGDPFAEYYPPKNKGNEAASYLTFIIDYYDALPKSMLFLHGHRRGWHDTLAPSDWVVRYLTWPEDPEYPYVAVQCPEVKTAKDPWSHPANPSVDRSIDPRRSKAQLRSSQFAEAWPLLFEEHLGPIPEAIAAPCCSEFLVSREAVLKLPKSFYENIREWLMTTTWDSASSSRVLEYAWHIMWTRNHQRVYENHPSCACYLYGLNCPGQEEDSDSSMLAHMHSVPFTRKRGMLNATLAVVLCLGILILLGSIYCHYCQGIYVPLLGPLFSIYSKEQLYCKPGDDPSEFLKVP